MFIPDQHTTLPDIAELVVHVPHVVFDVDGNAGRLQHLHGELLREGTNKQSSDSVDAGDLIRHADLLGLVPVLQVQYTCGQKVWEHGCFESQLVLQDYVISMCCQMGYKFSPCSVNLLIQTQHFMQQ